MKQGTLRGFGTEYLTGAVPPVDMPYHIVALCRDEADAVSQCIAFAKARFGYTQLDVAKLCGWRSDNHLSAYKRGTAALTDDPRRWKRFAQVTGCNLLEQYQQSKDITGRMAGQVSDNERNKAMLAAMLRAA
jgi:hypothetical protein